ncbi:hypothetical protein FHS16_005768 [Paenibacillus endophyticus]|uniref:Uncharacterized protein n=1 Tax=Paenibacillus endophyticus TaxID=1294268 RepID=A0A7W5CDF5_9BACL|nr:hypothetical protein [Paenibacillus endophyticus]MBB3155660.1 hypothetical protein [Paenibacillus endophyticus]
MRTSFSITIALFVFLILVSGCSKNETSIMEKIRKEFPDYVQSDEVYHAEMIKNGLLVFYKSNEGLGAAFIRQKSEDWEWVTGTGYTRLNPDEGLSALYANMDSVYLNFSYGVITDSHISEVQSSGNKAKIVQVADGTRIWFITYDNLLGSSGSVLPAIIGINKDGNEIITIQ